MCTTRHLQRTDTLAPGPDKREQITLIVLCYGFCVIRNMLLLFCVQATVPLCHLLQALVKVGERGDLCPACQPDNIFNDREWGETPPGVQRKCSDFHSPRPQAVLPCLLQPLTQG